MRTPSNKVRSLAIEALELAASNYDVDAIVYEFSPDYRENGRHGPVTKLMQAAWMEVIGLGPASLAGAACLLRDGWSPGEPTIDLGGIR